MSATTDTIASRGTIGVAAATLMIVLTFSWGMNGVAVKFANTGYSPVFLAFARAAIGGALVFAWCWYRNIELFRRDGTLLAGLLAGFLFGGEFTLMFIGLDYTTVARSALMVNAMPFWVLVGAHFLLGERMSLAKMAGLMLAFAGVVLVFSDELSLPGPDAIIGDILCLIAGLLWAATILVIKSSGLARISAEKLLLYQLAVSAVMAVPLLPLGGPVFRDVSMISTVALLFQAVYIVAFTFLLWFWLLRRYPATGLSSFAFLTPAFGVLLGGLVLGEPLSVKLLGALGLIALGLVVVNRPPRRREQ